MLLLRLILGVTILKELWKTTKRRYQDFSSNLQLIFLFICERKHLILDLSHALQIDIMKKLRHPNVLLFMGAVYSQERLAIVTEYLPRWEQVLFSTGLLTDTGKNYLKLVATSPCVVYTPASIYYLLSWLTKWSD